MLNAALHFWTSANGPSGDFRGSVQDRAVDAREDLRRQLRETQADERTAKRDLLELAPAIPSEYYEQVVALSEGRLLPGDEVLDERRLPKEVKQSLNARRKLLRSVDDLSQRILEIEQERRAADARLRLLFLGLDRHGRLYWSPSEDSLAVYCIGSGFYLYYGHADLERAYASLMQYLCPLGINEAILRLAIEDRQYRLQMHRQQLVNQEGTDEA